MAQVSTSNGNVFSINIRHIYNSDQAAIKGFRDYEKDLKAFKKSQKEKLKGA